MSQLGFGVAQGQEKHLASHIRIAAFDGFFLAALQQRHQVTANLHLILALHLRQFFHRGFSHALQARHIHASALQQGFGAIGLAQHGQQQVGRLDVSVVSA